MSSPLENVLPPFSWHSGYGLGQAYKILPRKRIKEQWTRNKSRNNFFKHQKPEVSDLEFIYSVIELCKTYETCLTRPWAKVRLQELLAQEQIIFLKKRNRKT